MARDRQRRYRSWLVNLGDQVERWRERCTRLDVYIFVRRLRWESGKTVAGQVKEQVPDASFLIDRSSLPESYVKIFY